MSSAKILLKFWEGLSKLTPLPGSFALLTFSKPSSASSMTLLGFLWIFVPKQNWLHQNLFQKKHLLLRFVLGQGNALRVLQVLSPLLCGAIGPLGVLLKSFSLVQLTPHNAIHHRPLLPALLLTLFLGVGMILSSFNSGWICNIIVSSKRVSLTCFLLLVLSWDLSLSLLVLFGSWTFLLFTFWICNPLPSGGSFVLPLVKLSTSLSCLLTVKTSVRMVVVSWIVTLLASPGF